MEERKKRLLLSLLEATKFVTTEQFADELGVSEKTIRTDLKWLDQWLKPFESVRLIRQPGMGILIEAPHHKRQEILKALSKHEGSHSQPNPFDPHTRKTLILKTLLESDRYVTTGQLADQFYVSKATISHDLDDVEKYLTPFCLQLIRKPNCGLKVEGDERGRRTALAKLADEKPQGLSPGQRNDYDETLITDVIRILERSLDFPFTDEAVSRLAAHLAIAVKRIKTGKIVRLSDEELQDLKQRNEYQLAVRLAEAIEKKLAIHIPQAEIGYIALHLLGAKIHYTASEGSESLEHTLAKLDPETLGIANKLISKVEELVQLPLSADQELWVGLAIHMHAALHRIRHRLRLTNPILDEIKRTYRYMFETLVFSVNSIADEFGETIPEDEIGYLALHFQAALERFKGKQKQSEIMKALLVCTTGVGTSQLLAAKIKRFFPDLHLLDTVSSQGLKKAVAEHRPDLLISTVPLKNPLVPTVCVTPLFTEQDRAILETELKRFADQESDQRCCPILRTLLKPELIRLDVDARDPNQVIKLLADELQKQGYVRQGYAESALAREQLSSTYIGGGVSIPHGLTDYIQKSAVAVARLKHPIHWTGNHVFLIFMPAVKWSEKEKAERMFVELAELVENPPLLNRLRKADSITQFLGEL
jgi:activator of the mannose operon (transcriptional antiterminator)